MAKITAKVTGGAVKEFEGMETIKELRVEMGLDKTFAATVRGEPEDDAYELQDFDYVVFAPAVKGGKV